MVMYSHQWSKNETISPRSGRNYVAASHKLELQFK